MKNVLVSIVVVNYNGKEILKKTLDSFRTIVGVSYEIIVVDNASTDGSADFVKKKYPHVKWVQNLKNEGYTGINAGLPHCKGDFIFYTNNDAFLEKNSLKRLSETLQHDSSIAIAAPKVINHFDHGLRSGGTWLSRSFYNGHHRAGSNETLSEIPYMGIALIRKTVVEKFGYLFDPDYFIYAEDVDLGLRMRLMGYKTVHVPKAILYHMHSATTRKSSHYKSTFLLERNLLMTFFKVMPAGKMLLFLPYVLGMRAVAMLKDILTFKLIDALARLFALLWILFHAASILKKRRVLSAMKKANASFLMRIFTEKYLFSSKKINV